MQFLSWRGALKEGRAPMVAPVTLRRLRMVVHAELTGLVIIILCAALMARGIGYAG
jgi:putative membrane protein